MSLQELPEEIFEKILSYLDFEIVQKTCTLVCKQWRDLIRNSSNLSGEMALSLEKNDAATQGKYAGELIYKTGKENEITTVLSHWKKLHTLRIPCNMPGINLSGHPHLRKVILMSGLEWHDNLQVKKLPWIIVSKICYNPNHCLHAFGYCNAHQHVSPYPENVIQLTFVLEDKHIENYQIDEALEQIVSKMKNLESIEFQWALTKKQNFRFIIPVLRGLGLCPKLRKMHFMFDSDCVKEIEKEIQKCQLQEFFPSFALYCPNILKLQVEVDHREISSGLSGYHFSWISSLPSIKELILLDLYHDWPNVEDPLFKLKNLKSLKIDDTMFRDHKFLMDLHKLFPALEKLEYDGDGDDFPEYFWDVEILPDVLESLGKVKKLSVSGINIIFHDSEENGHMKIAEEETSLEVFNKAFDIIDKKFPRESTEIELFDKENWFWIKKEKGTPPVKYETEAYMSFYGKRQKLPENPSTELSIQEVFSGGPGEAILQTVSGEKIQLTPDLIKKIFDASQKK